MGALALLAQHMTLSRAGQLRLTTCECEIEYGIAMANLAVKHIASIAQVNGAHGGADLFRAGNFLGQLRTNFRHDFLP